MALLKHIDSDRKYRADNQKLYLLEKSDDDQKFSVVGSTGNIYEIERTDKDLWRCTCPDYLKRRVVCKHCYFVIEYCRGNKVPEEKTAPVDIVENWKKRTYPLDDPKDKDILKEGNCCGICAEVLDDKIEELISCLNSCSRTVHAQCYKERKSKGDTSCIYCKTFSMQISLEHDDAYENVSRFLKKAKK